MAHDLAQMVVKFGAVVASVLLLAGCGSDEGASEDVVYKVSVTATRVPAEFQQAARQLEQTEWVAPASGNWRVEYRIPAEPGSSEVDTLTKVYTGEACLNDPSYDTPSVRIGSRRFLQACAEDAVTARQVARYLREGDEPPDRFRVKRGRFEFLAVVEGTISAAEAERRRLFEIDADGGNLAREVGAGKRPSLPVDAYWFGPNLGDREALTAIEDRGEDQIVYVTFYVPPGEASNAYPGQDEYSPNEVQVVCKPLDDPIARKELQRLRRKKPRTITLAGGEKARLFAGVGGERGSAFAVVTPTTLVIVVGRLSPQSAEQLRPL